MGHFEVVTQSFINNEEVDATTNQLPIRYDACSILWHADIPARVWGEDALANLGVPTIVFGLFLIVPDVEAAAEKLKDKGYIHGERPLAYIDIPEFNNYYLPPCNNADSGTQTLDDGEPSEKPNVILLQASDWFWNLPASSSDITDWFPQLPAFLVAMLDKLLDLDLEDEFGLILHLSIWIGYVYLYVAEVNEPNFLERIPSRYRQLHSDALQDSARGSLREPETRKYYQELIRGSAMSTRNDRIGGTGSSRLRRSPWLSSFVNITWYMLKCG